MIWRFGMLLEIPSRESVVCGGSAQRLTNKQNLGADLNYPLTFRVTRSKTMKNVQPIICTGILLLAMSVSAVGKPGTISTTKTGTISTTKSGTISTTRTGVISTTAVGTISTTRAGLISSANMSISSDRFSFVELLLSVFGPW